MLQIIGSYLSVVWSHYSWDCH